MVFDKPLKVFLSYSHQDDPELGQEFRNHLTSLEDDGIIKLWWDRDITAGLEWDNEIEERLHESHIFLALTSASFNASGYIRGKEMKVAWERHETGKCRIIPIMWRDWHPPERFGALQFLPDRAHPVAASNNKDAVLRGLTENILRVAKEMMDGRWKPKQSALSPIPLEVAYLCNWTQPILQLNGLRPVPGVERHPRVLVLRSTLNDCADDFLKRVHRADLPAALDIEGPVHDIRPLDWPPKPDFASDFLHRALRARPEWEIEKKVPEGLTLIKTVAIGWGAGKDAVLREMVREWSEPKWLLPGNRCLLLVVSILDSGWLIRFWRNRRIWRQLEALADRKDGILGSVITLPRVEKEHALNWPALPEVRAYHRDSDQLLIDRIRWLYRWKRRMPMKRLARELLRTLQLYRLGEAP
jgi:hypothetical protein